MDLGLLSVLDSGTLNSPVQESGMSLSECFLTRGRPGGRHVTLELRS